MSIVSEIIERQQHNRNVARAKRSIWRQLEWGNLSHLYVEPPRLEPCRRCQHSDPMDCDEDYLERVGVMRRHHPMLEPDQIKAIVQAGLRAEAAMLAKFQGGNRA